MASGSPSPVVRTDTKITLVNTVVSVFMGFTALVLALRIYARGWVVRAFGTDDALITAASVFSWAFCIIIILSTKYGLGQHIENVVSEPDMFKTYVKYIFASALAYNSCLGFIKLSVLALYLRITPNNIFRNVVITMICVVAAQTISNIFSIIFQCTPVSFAWTQIDNPKGGTCININAFYLANAALNITTDFLTYTIPMPVLWKLQLPKRQKLGLVAILSLGGFAVLSSIVRITYVVPMLSDSDATWVIVEPMYWSVIETNVGIFAASIPSYKALIQRYLPRLLGSRSGGSQSHGGLKYLGRRATSSHNLRELTDNQGGRKVRGQSVSVIKTHVSAKEQPYSVNGTVNGSEEMIIPQGRDGIMRTTHVTMSVLETDRQKRLDSDDEESGRSVQVRV